MTIKQYQTLAAIVSKVITDLGGDPRKVRNLKATVPFEIGVRNKLNKSDKTVFEHGSCNLVIKFDTISNPNNPNCMFRTLKPGSMSLYNSEENINYDASDFNYDSSQFADLTDAIQTVGWEIAK